MDLLVADIGGTNSRLAIWTDDDGGSLEEARVYPSAEHDSLGSVVECYLTSTERRPEAASLAVAGPVENGLCRATNLPWRVEAAEIARRAGLDRVLLLNDVEAAAWGAMAAGPSDLHPVHPGGDRQVGNACLIAPGTGLGEAGLYWDGRCHRPFAGEGGHTDFAPTSDLELEFFRCLRRQHGRVSWERVVSGPGLMSLYRFLGQRASQPAPPWLEREIAEEGGQAVTRAALAAADPVCVHTVELFLELLGREAGNLALKMMASGGVFIGGGIVPRLLPALARGAFLRGFTAKGVMADLVETFPVWVLLDPNVALKGAARALLTRAV